VIPVGFQTVADDKLVTRISLTAITGPNKVQQMEVKEKASAVRDVINRAVKGNDPFVVFTRPDGGSVAVKVDRILHASEVSPEK
jgi:hypothetical protein